LASIISFFASREDFALVHALVDDLQVVQRHDGALLQVDQLLLQFLDRGQVAAHHRAVGLAGRGFLHCPVQVQHVRREGGHEVVLRHAALVDHDLADLALVSPNVVDLAAQHAAQPLDDLDGEADRHQLTVDRLLRRIVGGRAVALRREGLVHAFEVLAQRAELLQGLGAQFLELLGQGPAATVAVVVLFLVELVEVLLGDIVIGLVVGDEAVDDIGDRDLASRDLVGQRQDLGDRRRRCPDGQHHRLQTALDALGDLDLSLASEQFDRAHLAHVHAHRVGGASELGVHRRQRGLGGFLGLLVGGGGRVAAADQQRGRIRRLLVDGDAHVVEHRDDGLEDLLVDQLLGQVVVDLLVGQEAPRLAHLDERLELLAAFGDLFLGQRRLVQAELAHQRALLGARDLHPQWLGLGFGFGCLHRICRVGRGRKVARIPRIRRIGAIEILAGDFQVLEILRAFGGVVGFGGLGLDGLL